jgi:hypothetical protein
MQYYLYNKKYLNVSIEEYLQTNNIEWIHYSLQVPNENPYSTVYVFRFDCDLTDLYKIKFEFPLGKILEEAASETAVLEMNF